MTKFKDMLKYYRNAAGLSQAELAKKIGVSPSTISMYEVGKREPDFETEEKLADFFNVSLNVLRGKDDEEPRPVISKELREIMERYDKLEKSDQKLVLNMIRSLSK